MACDTRLKPKQTISERAKEIRDAIVRLSQGIAAGRIKVKQGPQGAFALEGWDEASRDGITDACAYRQLQRHGTLATRMAIEKAESMAGKRFDQKTIAQGVHSHDGGATWHKH